MAVHAQAEDDLSTARVHAAFKACALSCARLVGQQNACWVCGSTAACMRVWGAYPSPALPKQQGQLNFSAGVRMWHAHMRHFAATPGYDGWLGTADGGHVAVFNPLERIGVRFLRCVFGTDQAGVRSWSRLPRMLVLCAGDPACATGGDISSCAGCGGWLTQLPASSDCMPQNVAAFAAAVPSNKVRGTLMFALAFVCDTRQ